MTEPVIVTAHEGAVVHQSPNNPDYGWVRVIQKKQRFEDSFAKSVTESALILGRFKDLVSFGWKEGQELPGQIVVKEQLEPFSRDPKYQDKDLKIAGDTGVVCSFEGQSIYRKNIYTTDMNDSDVFIAHDNEAEIKEAQSMIEESESAISANENFDV